ncbi:hypothetical protein J3R30DRAFT_3435549 [Lentinula aciculospora]|uniref:Uncharacterized protein n=1 Tax=Lentinula aciculospora TaxID=153920 RepID=A0A9W9AR04_9AGAR|nr:hypothetical protein J3R30DRAFT_3435549 [Lentinula aciculospora]
MFLRKKAKHQQQNGATSEKMTKAMPTNEPPKSAPLFARFATSNTNNADRPNGSATTKPMVSGPMSLGMRRDPMPSATGNKVGSGRKDGTLKAGGQNWVASEKPDKPLPPTLPSEEVKPAVDYRVSASGPVPLDPSRIGRKISTQKTRDANVADTVENAEPQSILSSRPSTTTRKSSVQDLRRSDINSYSARVGVGNDAPSDPTRNNSISRQTPPTYAHGPTSNTDLGLNPSYRHRESMRISLSPILSFRSAVSSPSIAYVRESSSFHFVFAQIGILVSAT